MSKPANLRYQIIDREGSPELYDLMDEIVAASHAHLCDAKIVLAWCFSWKPNKDGQLILGQCRKASDLDRQMHSYDITILLNYHAWTEVNFTDLHKRALLDHELCHADLDYDKDGEPREDAHGRKIYRIRRHDLEEFRGIVERYGCWKGDIEAFVQAAMASRKPRTLFDEAEDDTLGGVSITGDERSVTFSRDEVH
jgi:hypothetical protein